MFLTTAEVPLQPGTVSPATLSVTILPFGMTKDISSEKTGKFTLKAKVRYHCHLCPPLRHHVIVRHLLAYPPPPPRVMTSFMNSPLGGFPENHQNVICRQTEFFGNKTTAIKVAWNLFSELYVFSRFLNKKKCFFFRGPVCLPG